MDGVRIEIDEGENPHGSNGEEEEVETIIRTKEPLLLSTRAGLKSGIISIGARNIRLSALLLGLAFQ